LAPSSSNFRTVIPTFGTVIPACAGMTVLIYKINLIQAF